MGKLKKFLSILALIVLVGSDFLTSFSYALDDILQDSEVVQTENEEETLEQESMEEEGIDYEEIAENEEDEEMVAENDSTEELMGTEVDLKNDEDLGIDEETSEELTGMEVDLENTEESILSDKQEEELEGTGVELSKAWETLNDEKIEKSEKYNKVTVSVSAKEGTFPEGTDVVIEPIKSETQLDEIREQINESDVSDNIPQNAEIVAFDIKFEYELSDGTKVELQPLLGESVQVTFDYSDNQIFKKADKNKHQEIEIYHINDKNKNGEIVEKGEETVEKMDINQKESEKVDNALVIDAESFSIYVVTYGNEDPELSATLAGDDSARNNFHYKTITISDGTHTYTLMDRNLGARVAWNTGTYAFDDKSNYNTEDDYYGYYYQWGNSYGFSTNQIYGKVISDAIPSNYVSSTWGTSNLGGYNLRGDTTNTESARQGPCPRGWHVPSADEWEAIHNAWCLSAGKEEGCAASKEFAKALQMPTAGYRIYNYGQINYNGSGVNGYYWSSTSSNSSSAIFLLFNSFNNIYPKYTPGSNEITFRRITGMPVRCLKNNIDAVTLYLNPNGGRVEDGIKDADAQGKVILPTASRDGYVFDGWFASAGESEKIGDVGGEITINEDTDLYAHWSEPIPNPIVTFNNGATVTEFEVEGGGTLTNEQIQQISNLTHTKATFDGWYTNPEFNQTFDFNTPITGDISLYAKWTCKPGYTTLQGNGGPDMNCFEYETISYEDNDGNKHVLMDRNLGAQMIGFLYDADSKSYGYYYQWGNNYGFGPFTIPITGDTQVDCTNINPSTYSSSTFIMGSNDFDWCSSRNNNLWGGSEDNESNNRGLDLNNFADRQGPCPSGWHVPSIGERKTLLVYWASGNNVTLKTGNNDLLPYYNGDLANYNNFKAEFKIPIAGRFHYMVAQLGGNGGGGSANLWSSSSDINMRARQFQLTMNGAEIAADGRDNRAIGESVRCFMNNPKTVTFNYNGGEGEDYEIIIPSGTKVIAPADPTNGDKIFAGWYASTNGGQTLSATAFDFNEEITQNLDLYAKWVSCEDGEIYSPELGECVARWHELVSLTDDNTTTTVGSNTQVEGLQTTITVIENDILESAEGEELSEAEGKELAGDITIDFGGDAKFSHLVQVKIPVTGSSKAYVKVKHVGSSGYNFDGLTRNIEASCVDGDIENSNDKYDGAYMDVVSGYVSIYTCEASNFAAIGLPKVTFEPENGSGATVVEVESGAMVNIGDIPTVTKSGYNFSGWYLTGAESAFDFSGTAITGDITLYAKWQEGDGVMYTVTFDANRGTFSDVPNPIEVNDNEPIGTKPAEEPVLPGYIFTGWWTEPIGGTQWDFANDPVTGNITLYAKWEYNLMYGDLDVYMIDSDGSLIKYVMMDRNMGATGVYNKDFDNQNHNSFGFVYQWGNNYGFPRCSSNGACNYSSITETLVSVDVLEKYIPSKFASSTWIGKNGDKASTKSWHVSGSTVRYLWGNGNTTDMQGPCPDGYHVPLANETNNEGGLFRVWGNIYDKTINTITGGKGSGFTFLSYDQELFSSQFLLPHAGAHKKGGTKEQDQNICGDYWTATPTDLEDARNMWFCKDEQNTFYKEHGNFLFTNNSQRNNGSTLRCFKNSTSSANLDIVNGGKKGLITVEKVGGVATINAIKEPENTDASGIDLIFDGWYTSPTFESNTMKTGGDTLSALDTTLYAKWNCPDGSPYNSNNQCALGILVRFMDGETEYTRSIVLSGEEVSAPATNPEKSGYNFLGWFESGANSPFVFTGTPITGDLDLYAHWDINNYDVNVGVATGDEDKGYLSGMGSTGISLTGLYDYGTELVFIAIPELGYVFDYWMNGDQVFSGTDLGDGKNQLTVIVDQVLDIVAFFKETPTPYTVEHYQQNLAQTGYDFVWSGTMYGTVNEQTNATGANYEGFVLSGNLADYQTGIKADGSTVVRLYYNRDVYTVNITVNDDSFGSVDSGIVLVVQGATISIDNENHTVTIGDTTVTAEAESGYYFSEWQSQCQSPINSGCNIVAIFNSAVSYTYGDLDIYFVVDDSTGSHYTIKDRNPGATEAGTGSASFGYQYQWGNNHGFLSCETNGCSGFPGGETMTGSLVTNASDYGPDNYYSGSLFIKNSNDPYDWADPKNNDLWGDVTDALGDNPSARQGPCDAGYHVPSSSEWLLIHNAWLGVNNGNPNRCSTPGNLTETNACAAKIKNDLLLPSLGRRDNTNGKVGYTGAASYWTSTPSGNKGDGFYYNHQETAANNSVKFASENRARARSVRCVKDVYNIPLTININGGTKASVSVYSGSLHYLTNPTKEGYEFSGWYSDLTGNIKIEDGSTLPQGTTTLYAKWIGNNEAEYIFNASGGIFNSTSTEELVHVYTLNDEINSGDIETPIRTGYNFLGWYDESGEPINFPIVVTGNLNLYAHWEESGQTEATITVNHHWMNIGGSGYTIHETEYISGDIGDEFIASEKEYTGFTADPNNEKTIIISGDNNIIDLYYYRHWGYFYFLMDQFSVENITISGCDNGTCWYGEDVQLTVQEATGYTFNSWGIPTSITLPEGLDRTQKTLSFTMPEISDMQIRWSISLTAIPYTITYHLDGGEEVEHNQTGYTAGDFIIYVTDPVKTGYDFLGWTGGVINGPQLSSLTTGLVIVVRDMYVEVGDREYYANWSIKNYEVDASVATGGEGYLSGMGSTGINLTGLYDYATELVFIAIPELGYVFDYWKNGDTVLSGTDLGDGTNQLTVVVDQILDIIAFFRLAEYDVNIASSNTVYGTVSTGSVTKPYGTPITDNGNGTLTIDDVTVTATTGTAPAGYTYTFSGWAFSSECESGGNYVVVEGCTITGNFEGILNTYTVTFDLSGGSLTGDMTLTKDYTIETPAISLSGYVPERNGYTFTGWYRDSILVDSIAGGETGDYTLVARWEAQERPIPVVVFMKMLVPGVYTEYDSQLMWGWGTVGELYTAPLDEFTPTGFYYEEDNESNVRSVIVSPNVDNEVHLYFSRIPYPLIITNAGEGISSITTGGGDHLYEEPVTISVTPYTGWDFVSWSLSQGTLSGVNDLTQRTLSFNMPAEQVMISPILNHIEYTLSFDSASGTAVENQTYYYNDLLSGLDNAITTRAGYEFSGWYLSGVLYTSGSTMPAEDITLTAVWDINEYEVDASVATGGEGYLSGMGSTGISLTGLYDYATELVFIAIPELGYVFDYWKNGDTVLSGTDLGDGTNQLTVVVDQILDIIAFFKPADDTPYTVEHYQANVGLTGYDFVWSGTMYGTTNTQTNATGTDYEGFSLHNGDISEYQTGIKADGSTIVRLYYDRNRYIVTWNTWNGHEVTKTDVAYGQHPYYYLTPPERDVLDPEDEDYDFTFTGWTRSGVSGIVDLETEIVTGDITYTAEYDRSFKYYTVKYYPGEGTGIMSDQTNLQLHTSGNLTKNTFTRTGYIFSGWYSSMGLRYEDEQEINMGRADGFEYDLSGNFFLSLEAQWKPRTDTKVTVNYYLKNLDVENNILTGGSREYLTGVEFTGVADDIVDILERYGTGIEGYEYSKSIVYGPDFPGGVETGTTTILADGSRVIDMYYVPRKYNFTLNTAQYSSTEGSSESTGCYYGAKVTLSGDSNDDCFMWSGWLMTGITLSDNMLNQTGLTMPANDVEATPTVRENTYNIIFSGNGSTSGTMPNLSVQCTSGTLSQNSFEKDGYTFTGWSRTPEGTVEFFGGSEVHRLSTENGGNVTLYAVWDINEYGIDASVATGDEDKGYLSGAGSVGINLTGLYEYGTELIFIAVPELGYLFDYWEVNGSQELPEGVTASGNQLTVIVDQILDIVAHFTENVKTVTVNYYEMNTGGTYPGVTNTATFTGLVGYTGYATVQLPYGFHLDTIGTTNTGIVISDNDAENVINIYYARNEHNFVLYYTGDFEGEHMTPGARVNVSCTSGRQGWYYYGEHIHCEASANSGYLINGWTYSGGENVSINGGEIDFDMGDNSASVTLNGTRIVYNINYYLDGGIENPERPNNRTGYTVTDPSFQVYDPIKTGYVFLGRTGGVIDGPQLNHPTTGLIIRWYEQGDTYLGDREYFANWQRKPYEVILSVDPLSGGIVTGAGMYEYMNVIYIEATPNTGYHFVGWYDGENLVSNNSMYAIYADESGGTGLTARFEINQYYITIDKYGSGNFGRESATSGRYDHGTPIMFYASSNYGYKIQKWTKNGQDITTGENNELYTGYILDEIVTETGDFVVYFEPETYNIIYMDSGSILTGLSPTTYTVENHVYSGDLPSITKDGYIFAGWFYEYPRQPEYQIQEIGYVPVDGQSVTILAGWIPIDYNINYHLLTGVETIPWEEYYPYEFYQSYNIETPRISLPEPQKSGYVFSGWVDNYGRSLTGFGGGMTGNLDLYPTWRPDVMDITVNYYEMDTNGEYPYDPYYEYPTQRYYYTGLTDSNFSVPDYSRTGFELDWDIHPGGNPSIVVSGDNNANVINVYYRRAYNSVQIMSDNGSNFSISPYSDQYCWHDSYYYNCNYYFGTEVTISNQIYYYDEGYEFSGWYNDTEYPLPEEANLTPEYITFSMPTNGVHLYLYTNHILYKLTFTGYEGAEVTNSDVAYDSLTGENYHRYDTELILPYLNKPGYNFLGWYSGEAYVWSTYYYWGPNTYPTWNMPSHDVELTAVFSGRTDMNYIRQYYLQDIEGTGYTLSGDLTDFGSTGVTNQEIPGRYGGRYVTGFEYTGFGYSGEITNSWELRPYIKATGDNSVDYYYDRNVSLVDVLSYDDGILSVIGTGYYRYEAPVTLTFITKTGYEFSGIGYTSLYPDYDTGNSISFIMPDGGVIFDAYSKPIEYSIEYELNGGYPTPYGYLITGYTVEDELAPFDLYKDGYTFLGWTGGVIGVWELTEPTTGLIIPQGSIGNRKYFANFQPDEVNITVNYYLKNLDAENNVLTGGATEYLTGILFTGLTNDIVDIYTIYGTGIEGYEYSTSLVYGSDLDEFGIETGTTTILADGSRVINMYYLPKKYDFTVIAGQNTSISGTSISTGYYYGAIVTLSGASTDNCFEWDKWGSQSWPEGVENESHTTFAMPAHNVTVESMVSEKSYNIIFNGNGSTTGQMSTLSVQCTTGTLSPNNFERDGYTFTGWSRNSDGPVEFVGESDIHGLSTESGGTVNLYAIWDINHYTVTFDLNGGKLTGDMTLTTGYTVETPAISLVDYIPFKSGYIFTGWYKDDTLVTSIAGGETGDYTLTGRWEADNVVLHISYLGKMLNGEDYYIMSEGWDFPKVDSFYEAEIKDFTGFIYDPTEPKNITGRVVSWDGGQNDIQIYYKRNQYSLIITNTGEGISSVTTGSRNYLYEEPVTINITALTGWEFVNWTLIQGTLSGVNDLTQRTLSFNMPAEQVEISPILNHIEYTVSFDSASGTAVESQAYYYDDALSGLNNAITTRSGYSFSGWYLGDVLYTADSKMPAENITLTAKWKAETGIQYQVKHRGENIEGTAYDVLLLNETKYGETDDWTLANSGEFEGFTLSGEVEQKKINPSGTTVVDIYYIRNKYLITFKDGDGNVIQSGMVAYGATPVYTGDTPTKTTTPQYTYTFNDTWSLELTGVTSAQVYTAQFDSSLNSYSATISSNNTDFGTVSPASVTGLYGSTVEISGNVLTISGQNVVASPNEATAQYTYIFSEWNNTCGDEITGNCTITAEFTRTVNKYLITFVDGDGNTIQTGMVAYGETPEYTGATPTKTATAQYTYTFNDTWSPAIEEVTTGVTYTAQFNSTTNEYLITFVDGDGNTIQSGMVAYGETPEYTGATPTKTATAQYTYTFNDTWSPAIEEVTTGVTYTAQFNSTTNEYLITFVDGDGNTIQTGMVAYGETPEYIGATPTKTATAQYTYTFNDTRSPAVEQVTTGATYTAQFDSTVNKYLITFVDGDGNTIQSGMVAYGETPEYTGATPTKIATAQYTYTFNDTWSPAVEEVTTGATYTAQFSSTVNQYTATITGAFSGYGTLSTGSLRADYGSQISINGATLAIGGMEVTAMPTEPTLEYHYTFDGWTNNCGDELTGNCTITANFSRRKRSYTVQIASNNTSYGAVTPWSVTTEYGAPIVLDNVDRKIRIYGTTIMAMPLDDTEEYDYELENWSFSNCGDEGNYSVRPNCTITAIFTRTTNQYTVTIGSNNTEYGTVDESSFTVDYGTSISVSGTELTIGTGVVTATPEENTQQYTYTFSGWNNTCGNALTGTCEITAEFTRTTNEYLVTFVDGDGNTIQTGMVVYGEIPEYTGATPTKTATAQYTYTFNDTRSPAIEQVTTGVTYIAQFNATVNEYLITFKDGDGNTIQSGMVVYGETPEYTGATPTKTATAQYTYTFNDAWSPSIEQVTTGATYTAQFSSTVNKYLITFVDGDGNTIQSGMVAYGETPVYSGATPTKTATAQYTYTFNDTWSPAVEEVTTGVTYTAQFDSSVNKYLITFVDGDGNTIQTGMVAYGETPVYSGDTPTKTATDQYSYTFNNSRSPAIEEVTTGVTYTAQFSSTVNKYLITFVDGDGNTIQTGMVAYGEIPVYSGATPTKTATAQYTYTFNDTWSPAIEDVTTGATYTAQFDSTVNSYIATITSNNTGYGTVSPESLTGQYGAIIEISGNVITISGQNIVAVPKESTAQYTYTFSGWNNTCGDEITGNCTITAEFTRTVNEYLITFKDGDGNVIQSGMVTYGDTPVYSGYTPTKTATAQYSYTFNDSWSPAIEDVTTGATYTAQFNETTNSYTINIVPNDTSLGTISTGEITVVYGSPIVENGNKITIGDVEIEATPNDADVQYTYEFDSWTNTCGSELIGTCTIKANFKKTVNKYTITWKNDDGSVIDSTSVAYGTVPSHATPTKASTDDYRYVFAGWTPDLSAVVGDAEYTATFTEEEIKKSENNNMSGGGRRSNKDDSDNQHKPTEEDSDGKNLTGDIDNETGDINNEVGNVDAVTLSLYQWARQNNITTMDTLEEADPDGPLTRGHMAKMVVNFAQNVLGRNIPTTYPDKCNWNDKESERESLEIKEYAKKACSLGLMGIYVDEFMPNKILDRAEFGTIISRLLWGDTYNIIDTDHRSYYEDHLRLLKKNGILTQIDDPEDRWEIRKWVWLVFKRISEKKKS